MSVFEGARDVRAPLLRPPRGVFVCDDSPRLVVKTGNPHHGRTRRTGAQKAGLAYEKRAGEFLQRERPGVLLGQWFKFSDRFGNFHYCQPDAIVEGEQWTTVIEIKLRFHERAWWQLNRLYAPVVESFYGKPTVLICLTRSFDPHIPLPSPVGLVSTLDAAEGLNTSILLWDPKFDA